jgi:GMP synthase (glutamine-hydrolysing)
VWNSHGDRLNKIPYGFQGIAKTDNSEFAVLENPDKKFYGLQYHPEVAHSDFGKEVIHNFLFKICGCVGDWSMHDFMNDSITKIRQSVGEKRVLLGLSGGVDSSVAAALIHKAIGDKLTCVFVDNGLLRKNERKDVEDLFAGNFAMDLRVVDAKDYFLDRLSGITDPEQKRKIIGVSFVEIFDQEVDSLS